MEGHSMSSKTYNREVAKATAQIEMIRHLEAAEALAPRAGVTRFAWQVKTVTGYEQQSEWRPDGRGRSGTNPLTREGDSK